MKNRDQARNTFVLICTKHAAFNEHEMLSTLRRYLALVVKEPEGVELTHAPPLSQTKGTSSVAQWPSNSFPWSLFSLTVMTAVLIDLRLSLCLVASSFC